MKNSEIMKKNNVVVEMTIMIISLLASLAFLATYIYFKVSDEKFTLLPFIIFAIVFIILIVKIASGKKENDNSILRAGGIDKIFQTLDNPDTIKISKKLFVTKDEIIRYKMGIKTIQLNDIIKVEQAGDGGKYLGIKRGAYKIELVLREGIVEEISFGSGDKEKEKYANFMKNLKQRAHLADFGFDKNKECKYN